MYFGGCWVIDAVIVQHASRCFDRALACALGDVNIVMSTAKTPLKAPTLCAAIISFITLKQAFFESFTQRLTSLPCSPNARRYQWSSHEQASVFGANAAPVQCCNNSAMREKHTQNRRGVSASWVWGGAAWRGMSARREASLKL